MHKMTLENMVNIGYSTCNSSSFAMALSPLEDEEGVRPLTHPQRISNQYFLGSDPHVGPLRSGGHNSMCVCVCVYGLSKA